VVCDREVGLVAGDRAPDHCVGLPLAGLAEAEPALDRIAHGSVDLLRERGLRSLVVERKDRHRLDVGREPSPRESVAAAEKEGAKACEKPKYQAQRWPAWSRGT